MPLLAFLRVVFFLLAALSIPLRLLAAASELRAMGANTYGQLGDGSTTNRTLPVQVPSAVASISAGGSHSLFIKSDGSLWTMGYNLAGQLGDGSTANRAAPVQIATGVVAVAADESHSLFIKSGGSLWAMGYNSHGQLGDGSTTSRKTISVTAPLDGLPRLFLKLSVSP